MRKTSSPKTQEAKLDAILSMLEHLIVISLYRGGATQTDISRSLDIATGKVSGLLRGVKPFKESNDEKK